MLKFNITYLLVFIALLSFGQTFQRLAPQAFESKLKEKKSFTLLDVRTPNEYNGGHLNGAIPLDYYRKDFKLELNKLDKSKPVFVYCAVGGRSSSTTALLSSLGFKEVYDLAGGIQAWSHAKKPIIQ